MKKLGIAIYLGINIIGGMGIGIIGARTMLLDKPLWYLLVLLAFIYVAMMLSTIVHEAGHLIFGMQTGYKFQSFRIGSVMISKESDGYHIRKFSLAGTAGQCIMTPPELVDGKIPFVWYNLGGVAANVIFTGIMLGLAMLMPSDSVLAGGFLLIALFSICMALSNGIPLQLPQVNNDGYNILSLSKNKDELYAFWVQLAANAEQANGLQLKEMPSEWFVFPKEDALKGSLACMQAVLCINRPMDEHNFELTLALLQKYLKMDTAIIGIHRGLLLCDEMTCMIILGKNKEDILALYDKEQQKFMKSMATYPGVIRTYYAIEKFVNGNLEEADKWLTKFEKVSKSYPYESEIRSEREILTYINQKAEEEENESDV